MCLEKKKKMTKESVTFHARLPHLSKNDFSPILSGYIKCTLHYDRALLTVCKIHLSIFTLHEEEK